MFENGVDAMGEIKEDGENETDTPLNARRDLAIRLAMFGAISGVVATMASSYGYSSGYRRGMEMLEPPENFIPGLVFGLIVGFILWRDGILPNWRYPAYIVAAGLSYFAAVEAALYSMMILDNGFLSGIFAGLIGAGLLTVATAMLIQREWRLRLAIPIVTGAVLGCLLVMPLWLLLFVPWQAGYAAALAFALDDRRQLTPPGVETSGL